jgi:hypothetical protein
MVKTVDNQYNKRLKFFESSFNCLNLCSLMSNSTGLPSVRIRTVTAFVALPPPSEQDDSRDLWEPLLKEGRNVLYVTKQKLEQHGYEVQTTRIATNPHPEYTTARTLKPASVILDEICADNGECVLALARVARKVEVGRLLTFLSFETDIMMLNIGPAAGLDTIPQIPDVISVRATIPALIEGSERASAQYLCHLL